MGGKTPDTHAANLLASLSQQMFAESNPARRLMFQQLTEALKTGGVGARIPIIQRAVENVNMATANSAQKANEQFARAGIGGSPIAAEAVSGIKAAGAQRAAEIPTEIAQELIAGGPGLVSSGSGIPGLSAAASLQQSAANQGAQNQAMIYGGIGQGVGSLAGAAASNINYNPGTGFSFGGSSS